MSLRRVRKRDGREVPFAKDVIAAAVVRAQNAVGQHDPVFAREVADLVELALRRRYAWRGSEATASAPVLFENEDGETTAVESVPGIEEIQDLVEVGLIELGRAGVAKAYILYRDRRSRARDAYEHTAAEESGGVRPTGVQVRESEGTSPWSKARIAAALVHEAELSRTQAEQVAARVESRVVASRLKRLSTGLIREFVDNELVSMGLAGALARQAPVSLPRHDLRELLESGPQSLLARKSQLGRQGTVSATGALGGDVMRRYAMADVFSEGTVEHHLCGDFHIEDLRAPHLYLTQSISADLLQRGEPSSRGAFDALDEIAMLFGSVSQGIVLENPSALLLPLTRSQRPEPGGRLTRWLLALSALAKGAARRVDFAGFGSKGQGLLGKLVLELDGLREDQTSLVLPRLFVEGSQLTQLLAQDNSLKDALDRLLDCGLLLPTWSSSQERYLGPGGSRRSREHGGICCGGAVAVNLARIARHAGPWREDLMLEATAHLVEHATAALSRLAKFQRSSGAVRPGADRSRVAYALVPVGLREALRQLGDGELRAEQGSRVLGLLSDAARRFASAQGLTVHLSAHYGQEAAARFAVCDGSATRVHQGTLFAEVNEGAEALMLPTRPYSTGFDLGVLPGQCPGETSAQLLATVPAGSWRAPSRLQQNAPVRAQLAAWQSFEQSRASFRERHSRATSAPQRPTFFQSGDSLEESPSVVI
ncbi:MAG: hypothetical protein ACI9F9_000764 [Candidatus Paceibacteria bacterium]|jgi:hypothetical protein